MFDTVREYGEAEASLGRWIAERGSREEILILSKCGHSSMLWEKRINEIEIRKDYLEFAKSLNMDYIDIYLLRRDDPDVKGNDHFRVAVQTLFLKNVLSSKYLSSSMGLVVE